MLSISLNIMFISITLSASHSHTNGTTKTINAIMSNGITCITLAPSNTTTMANKKSRDDNKLNIHTEQLTKNIPIHCISVTALIIGTGTMFLNVISMQ